MKRKGNKKYKYVIFVIYDAIYQELIYSTIGNKFPYTKRK